MPIAPKAFTPLWPRRFQSCSIAESFGAGGIYLRKKPPRTGQEMRAPTPFSRASPPMRSKTAQPKNLVELSFVCFHKLLLPLF